VLFGRAEEAATLQDALRDATEGRGRLVVVLGEAGIGKTALVRQMVAAASGSGLAVAAAEASPMDAHRPFGPWRDALGLAEVPALAPFQIVDALIAEIECRCAHAPQLIVLEDLHFADPACLDVLGGLARSLGTLPVAVVCTLRPRPRLQALEQLLDVPALRGQALELPLGPLSGAACTELVTGLLGAPPGPELVREVQRTGGNPLFVTELVEALRREDLLTADASGTIDLRGAPRLPSLWATLLRHLSLLPAPTRELLSLAAVLGGAFSAHDLSLVSGRPVVDLAPLLREAVGAGVLGERGDRLVFRHDLMREALYEEIPGGIRPGLHREVAHALLRAGVPAAALAEHLLRGVQTGDAPTLEALTAVAAELTGSAPALAAELWRRAGEFTAPAEPAHFPRRLGLAQALLAGGRAGEAESLCREILAAGGASLAGGAQGDVGSCLVYSLIVQGRIGEAQAELARLEATSDARRAEHLGLAAMMASWAGEMGAAAATARDAAALAEAAGNLPARIRALTVQGHVQLCAGELAEAEAVLRVAAGLAERAGTASAHDTSPLGMLGLALVDEDRLDEAQAWFARGRLEAQRRGAVQALHMSHLLGVGVPLAAGRYDDTQAEIEATMALAEDAGLGWTGILCALRALIVLYREGPEAAAPWLLRCRSLPAAPAYHGMGWYTLAHAEHAAAGGDHERALELLLQGWRSCLASGVVVDARLFAATLAGAATRAGNAACAAEVVETIERLAARNPHVPSIAASAARARGLASGDADALLEALAACRASVRRHEHARAAEDAAIALAEQGRRQEAARAAAEALTVQDALGLPWEAARCRAALRRAGLRPALPGRRSRPTAGWQALTATERRVAELVADGLSNPDVAERLFLSRRTVESHVSHILGKLRLASRRELIATAARRGAASAEGEWGAAP